MKTHQKYTSDIQHAVAQWLGETLLYGLLGALTPDGGPQERVLLRRVESTPHFVAVPHFSWWKMGLSDSLRVSNIFGMYSPELRVTCFNSFVLMFTMKQISKIYEWRKVDTKDLLEKAGNEAASWRTKY